MTLSEFPVVFPPDFPDATGLLHLTETGSTNDEARRLFASQLEGHVSPIWIMTDRQVSGRGRMGRNWSSPEGNLMTSLMCKPRCDLSTMGQLGFVAGLAVQESIQEMTTLSAKLKWPNDVLIEGAKCAGILLETLSNEAQEIGLAIGIGIRSCYCSCSYFFSFSFTCSYLFLLVLLCFLLFLTFERTVNWKNRFCIRRLLSISKTD